MVEATTTHQSEVDQSTGPVSNNARRRASTVSQARSK
jgi:hypothetical protein